ncbi:MAG TPA: hypothetical protein VK171_11235 [Fimbriimonas sp.]|nr:hypothetical protein [Fimbriimonas sp.]
MFRWLKELLDPTWERLPALDTSILANICFNAEENGRQRVRIQEAECTTKVFDWVESEWIEVGELPSEQAFMQRFRFATNSRGCADLGLPRGEAEVEIPGRYRYRVQVLNDEVTPQNFIEIDFKRLT